MSMLPGKERAKHKRWPSDFYVEPEWTVEALFDALRFKGPIHDPAAGYGAASPQRAGLSQWVSNQ